MARAIHEMWGKTHRNLNKLKEQSWQVHLVCKCSLAYCVSTLVALRANWEIVLPCHV